MQMELSFFVIFVILNQHSPVTADLACGSDQSENDGSCYYFSEISSNFASSKASCENLGMHLVYIGSQEEQNLLQSSLSGKTEKYWIGLSQMTWIDGSSLDYNYFYHNKFAFVFNDGGICFRMYYVGHWYDTSCTDLYYFICENEIEDSAACSVGHTENGGSCYYFSQSKSNFDTSKSSCDDLGMHLVYIGSEDEQEFIVNNLPVANEDNWLGLSSVTWLDGSSLTYSNFADDSKILDEGGLCFFMIPNMSYQWFDRNCNLENNYICEKEGGIQSSSVQPTTSGAVTSPERPTQTTPNQMTSSETSSYTTQTNNIVTTSGSTQFSSTTDDAISETTSSPASTTPTSHAPSTSTTDDAISEKPSSPASTTPTSQASSTSTADDSISETTSSPASTTPTSHASSTSTADDAISETTSSPASTTPTSQASSTSTTGQGSTDVAAPTSELATDTPPATAAMHTTQTMSSATRRSSPGDRGHMSSKNFRLLASNVALIDAYVLSSYTVSSIIKCSQLCFADVRCLCYTFIACEGSCLLGKECLATSTYAFERRPGAKFYSALLEGQE